MCEGLQLWKEEQEESPEEEIKAVMTQRNIYSGF